MVYCGKPSGGCYACRERKSRCDQNPEGCGQCKRTKRVCPGYRQLGDVIFHDENERVVRKARVRAAKERANQEIGNEAMVVAASPSTDTTVSTSTTPTSPDSVSQAGYQSLGMVQATCNKNLYDLVIPPPREDLADGFFMSTYVYRIDGESGLGRFDYIAGDYFQYTNDVGLLSSMRAVGFASYAHSFKEPRLINVARMQYSQAIRRTNEALACPELAKRDTTLLSILILGIYETITGEHQKSLKDWSQHIEGAAAVIAVRGQDQYKTMAGKRMLFQVASNLMICCLVRKTQVPDFIWKYTDAAINSIEHPDPALHVQRTIFRAIRLQTDFWFGQNQDLHATFEKALELDNALLAISCNPPPGWTYETVHTTVESPYVWNNKYHVYGDCWKAQLWNSLRTIRVLLNELIRNVLVRGTSLVPPLFQLPRYTTQLQRSVQTLYELQGDILSTVAQHLFDLPLPASMHFDARLYAKMNGEATVKPDRLSPGQKDSQERLQVALMSNQPVSAIVTASLLPSRTIDDTPPANTRKLPKLLPRKIPTPSPSPFETIIDLPLSMTSWTNTTPELVPLPLTTPLAGPPARKATAAARLYGGNFLMWPLCFAAIMDIATDEVRSFAVRNLRDVGRELGIRQGSVLADVLETNAMYNAVLV